MGFSLCQAYNLYISIRTKLYESIQSIYMSTHLKQKQLEDKVWGQIEGGNTGRRQQKGPQKYHLQSSRRLGKRHSLF